MRYDRHQQCLDNRLMVDTSNARWRGCRTFGACWCATNTMAENYLGFVCLGCIVILLRWY